MMIVCEWVNTLQERLKIVREIARDMEMTAKQKSRELKYRKSKLRCFEEGSLVLRRAQGIRRELDEGWDGLYGIY